MKAKLLIIFFLVNTSFSFAQLTPQWEAYSSGLNYLQDSISDKDNYIFNTMSVWQSSQYSFLYNPKIDLYVNVDPSLTKLDSNNFARVVVETIRSFPKEGIYYSQYKDLNNFHHIEISNDRCKTWRRIFTLKANEDEIFDNIQTNELSATFLHFLNDSTILISGIFKEYEFSDSPYLAKLTRGSHKDSYWNFELIKYWRRTTSLPLDVTMLNDRTGYAQYLNILGKGFEILKTNDCWNTFQKIYPLDSDPKPINDFRQLCVSANAQDTLFAFYEPDEDMIYYTKDEFKTKQIIDFTIKEPVYRLYLQSPQNIFALTQISKIDQNKQSYYIYKLLKTTNFGNSWQNIFETPRGDTVWGLKIYDENHITISGIFHPQEFHSRRSLLQTEDGGKTWQYLFEPDYAITSNFVYSYTYINKDQIICVKSFGNTEQPKYDKDLTYFNQIKEYHNRKYTGELGYFQTSMKKTLIPPELKIDKVLYNRHNFDKDVLFWNKIDGAIKYRIKYYGLANTTLDRYNNFLYPSNFSTLTTQRIDTVVSDTFLTVYNLKRNYNYLFYGKSLNETQESENSFLETTSKEYPELEVPRFYYPHENIENPYSNDTVPTGEIVFRWKKVANSDFYNVVLFDTDYFYFNYLDGHIRYLLNMRNYKDTTLIYKDLKPNGKYAIIVTAQNNDEVSNCAVSRFVVKDDVSVPNENFDGQTSLYPNPTKDFIVVGIQNIESQNGIQIYDIFGKCVINIKTIHELPLRIDVSSLPTGVYFLKLKNQPPVKFIKL